MHLQLTDRYQGGDSFVHKMDPRAKLIAALVFIVALGLAAPGAFGIYLLFYLLLLAAAYTSGLGLVSLLKRSFVALPFVFAAATLPFTMAGDPLITLPIFGGLVITVQGSVQFLTVVAKSWLSVQAVILLTATTPFSDLLWGLRALHVPPLFVAIIAYTYRYLFVLIDEAGRLVQARRARSGAAESGHTISRIIWRGKVTGNMVGALLIRTLERAERIHLAMTARGFDGSFRYLSHPKMAASDYLALFAAVVLLGFSSWLSRF